MSAGLNAAERETLERWLPTLDPEPAAMVRRVLDALDAAEAERDDWHGLRDLAVETIDRVTAERDAAEERARAAERAYALAEQITARTYESFGEQFADARATGFRDCQAAAAKVVDAVVEEYRAGKLRIGDWTAHEVGRRLRALTPPVAKEHCPRRLAGEAQPPHAPCDTGDFSRDVPAAAPPEDVRCGETRTMSGVTWRCRLGAGHAGGHNFVQEPAAAEPREPACPTCGGTGEIFTVPDETAVPCPRCYP